MISLLRAVKPNTNVARNTLLWGSRNALYPTPAATRDAIVKQMTRNTTILCVRKEGKVVMAGDGQVSMGPTVVKGNAKKVRKIGDDILVGFAGSTADALTLLERLESKLEEHPEQLMRACVELAKAWRSDKYLRRLEATLLVADKNNSFELTGNGDVLEPPVGALAIGSGGNFALAAALALIDQPGVEAQEVVQRSMKIAGDICVYTNHELVLESLD
mmetsp:Transcript_10659/g.17387  ORF Transcript_10659/g.17387 Transcript_10659/m.17387 type:complete len:217 (-) Transcript_10659:1625-2275(-)|eukprot:CAMPEP_0174969080 /NCGR_PEP_ID=MMETSP0004_2-20121128/8528_1 /TAXON_ID=420556 /ORGANISM="Ochromonas sp., Strain CCMP1393" /LENGTH=216 /DNA_ID=CAMNT_0016218459 /DNA_START=15 /DNA_END=665 /DNA_ORIENTATION=+